MEKGKQKESRITNARRLAPEEIHELIEPCEVCGFILERDETVLMCEKCHAVYHENCFKQVLEQNEGHCRRCGYEFKAWD